MVVKGDRGQVEAMSTGSRGQVEVFSSVDEVGTIVRLKCWFQDIGFVFKCN